MHAFGLANRNSANRWSWGKPANVWKELGKSQKPTQAQNVWVSERLQGSIPPTSSDLRFDGAFGRLLNCGREKPKTWTNDWADYRTLQITSSDSRAKIDWKQHPVRKQGSPKESLASILFWISFGLIQLHELRIQHTTPKETLHAHSGDSISNLQKLYATISLYVEGIRAPSTKWAICWAERARENQKVLEAYKTKQIWNPVMCLETRWHKVNDS